MWGISSRKNHHQAAVILVTPVTFKNSPKGWRSPAELPGELAFLKRFAFFLKTGGGLKQHQGLFLFWCFFLSEGIDGMFAQQQKMIAKDFIQYFEKGSSFFRCLCQKNRPLLVSCFVLLGGELTDLVLKKMFFVTTLGPNFDYQDGCMGL